MRKISAFLFLLGACFVLNAFALPLNKIKLPPNFHISVYAKVPGAREMTLGDDSVVYVGSRNIGNVYALIPNENRTKAKKVVIIASELDMPNGVAFHKGNLYVAEVGRIMRYDNISQRLNHPSKPKLVTDKLPKKYHHGWRYIAFGPDDWLYISVGAPCNVCIRKDPRFATIMRMRADGSDMQMFAQGVRNTLGFDWQPVTRKLWFTDNGRDWLGDNLPPDELNYAPRQGMNFGFPYFYGNNVPDPKFGHLKSAKGMTPPVQNLNPHVAALGMKFYTGKMFPKDYHNQIIIAEHGSWNRSKKIGYRLTIVRLKENKAVSYKPFVTGWLQGQSNWGRPVDLLVMPDGSLLVSDDYAGVVYRISYGIEDRGSRIED